jgi:heme-degrading monooxygenase HmoA
VRAHSALGRLLQVAEQFTESACAKSPKAAEYNAEVERMNALAKTMPGDISHRGSTADDGEWVTIVEFEHEEGMRTWRMNPEHRVAQRKAREFYYADYNLQVCELLRESKFSHDKTQG